MKRALTMVSMVLGAALIHARAQEEESMRGWRTLSPDEERVIVHKGTEKPFSGRFEKFNQPGTYVCRRCDAALYRAEDKFDAHCGWPSFDAEVPGAVRRRPDADGRRTEILCARCDAHLGHVFTGERLTPQNVRHCVNSISMDFVPLDDPNQRFQRAVFAGGCFWGVEYFLQAAPGVIRTMVGYTGGKTENPTYKQVCLGSTGHAEAVEVVFDPLQTSFEKIARLFFEIHDPAQVDRQGPDIGAQYRSAVFYVDERQRQTTRLLMDELRKNGVEPATRVEAFTTFWPAEPYHRDYYRRNGKLPYCHSPVLRFGGS